MAMIGGGNTGQWVRARNKESAEAFVTERNQDMAKLDAGRRKGTAPRWLVAVVMGILIIAAIALTIVGR